MTVWSLEEALVLVRRVESICPDFSCHVALTGGVLYKDGRRKDLDLLFYRVRQAPFIDEAGLLQALSDELDFQIGETFGWLTKATHWGRNIDMFFPERPAQAQTFPDKPGNNYGM